MTGPGQTGKGPLEDPLVDYLRSNRGGWTLDALAEAAAAAGHAPERIAAARASLEADDARPQAADPAGPVGDPAALRSRALGIVLLIDVVGLIVGAVLTYGHAGGSGGYMAQTFVSAQVMLAVAVLIVSAWWISGIAWAGPLLLFAVPLVWIEAVGFGFGEPLNTVTRVLGGVGLVVVVLIGVWAGRQSRSARPLTLLLAVPAILLLIFPGTCIAMYLFS